MQLCDDPVDVGSQLRERRAIRLGTRPNDNVYPKAEW
jgi:hypothetical protein